MKIAVWHELNSGGGKRALYDHIKGLIERGHTVVSYCPDTIDQSYLPISTLTEERIFPLKSKIARRVKRFGARNVIYERMQAEFEHCQEVAADINANNFDLLFANSSSNIQMSHIGRFVNIPKLIYLGEPYRILWEATHGSVWRAPLRGNISRFRYGIRSIRHLYKMFWNSYIAREEYISACSYDFILVNSFFSRESVKRVYNLNAKVCYLGIDTDKFSPRSAKTDQFVMGLGTIHKHKGIEQCIEAISKIPVEVRLPLVWVGNARLSAYSDELIQYAQKLGVTLSFESHVSDESLLTYLSKASALLYFPHLEPFGLAPLEANACGTAVIGIKEGGIRETIVHGINGFLVDEFNPEKIAEFIKLFAVDLQYAVSFGQKSREHIINNWGQQKGIDNIENIMFELVNKPTIYA